MCKKKSMCWVVIFQPHFWLFYLPTALDEWGLVTHLMDTCDFFCSSVWHSCVVPQTDEWPLVVTPVTKVMKTIKMLWMICSDRRNFHFFYFFDRNFRNICNNISIFESLLMTDGTMCVIFSPDLMKLADARCHVVFMLRFKSELNLA